MTIKLKQATSSALYALLVSLWMFSGCQQNAAEQLSADGQCHTQPRPDALIIAGTGGGLALIRALGQDWASRDDAAQALYVPTSLGSGGGLRALEDGAIDAALSALPLDERRAARGFSARLIGTTPLVFVVSANRDVQTLTPSLIEAYYSHKRRRWSDGTLVTPLFREPGDNGLKLLIERYPALKGALSSPASSDSVLHTNQAMRDALLETPGALGWLDLSTLYESDALHRLKALSLDGLPPTAPTYPLHQPLYLILPPTPKPALRALIEHLKHPSAQTTMRAYGYAPAPH